MNTPNDSRPRLLCRAVRGWSVLAGDPATGAAARHVAACPDCQKFFAASATLDARLRTAAPRRAQALPQGFEQRMERALAPLMREPAAAAESGSRWIFWSFLGSVAAAAAVAFVLLRPADVPTSGPGELAGLQTEAPVPGARPISGEALLGLAQVDPLQREIDHVYADAQSALRFLALNFLPESATSDAPSS